MTDFPRVGYVLLAGTDPRRADLSEEVLGRFPTEEEARQAFLAVRLSPDYVDGWAELVGVDGCGAPAPLCWFGHRPPRVAARPIAHEVQSTRQSHDVHVTPHGGAMKTQEKPRPTGPVPELERPLRSRRSRAVATVVTALAAATLAIAAVVSDAGDDTPSEPPVAPAGHVVPFDPPAAVSEGVHSLDG